MKDTARALAGLPDDARCSLVVGSGDLTVGELREAFASGDEPRIISIAQAHETWPAYSAETWRKAADAGEILNAWRDNPRGPWRLPFTSCEAYVAARQQKGRRRGKTGPKGPRAWYEEGEAA